MEQNVYVSIFHLKQLIGIGVESSRTKIKNTNLCIGVFGEICNGNYCPVCPKERIGKETGRIITGIE